MKKPMIHRSCRPGAKMKAMSRSVLQVCGEQTLASIEAIFLAMDAVGDKRSDKLRRTTVSNLQGLGYIERCNVAGVAHWRLTALGHAALAPPQPVEYSRRHRMRLKQQAAAPTGQPARQQWLSDSSTGAVLEEATGHLVGYAGGVIRIPRIARSVFDLAGLSR